MADVLVFQTVWGQIDRLSLELNIMSRSKLFLSLPKI